MDGNGMLPNLGSGMLGLEMPLHPPFSQHQNSNSNMHQQREQYPTTYTTKGKQTQQQPKLGLSDEDEQASQWQRVKWADAMVRLLIMVVYYIGDDGFPEGKDPPDVNKKTSGAVLHKKGKWKSVSKAMMEKGFYVSPQQCEDKFNDLNKRYKRVIDILGKGTACNVVENQSLLDTMDQLSLRMKEEARKLLNSKQLFFREMCAYHNSGLGARAGGVHQSPQAAADFAHQHQLQQSQQQCLHSPDGAHRANVRNRTVRGGVHEEQGEDEENEDDEEENDESDESEDSEENQDFGGSGNYLKGHSGGQHGDVEFTEWLSSNKKQRSTQLSSSSGLTSIQELSCELMSVLEDGTKSLWEQRQWIRSRSMQLEEQRMSYQCQAYELEKQRMKWVKFSWNKEREMERIKLNNEQTRLETERMVLSIRQKELELLNLHRHQQESSIKHSSLHMAFYKLLELRCTKTGLYLLRKIIPLQFLEKRGKCTSELKMLECCLGTVSWLSPWELGSSNASEVQFWDK